MQKQQNIVISGASGGLGRALVKAFAAPGVTFFALGRDAQRLEETASLARMKGAGAITLVSSSSDQDLVAKAISEFDIKFPIDLLICAAGSKTGNTVGIEDVKRMVDVFDVNLIFPAFLARCVLRLMEPRNSGQIALVSSVAAIAPLPDILSYSASKAGLNAFGASLRRSLLGTGISVSLIIPGFIDTPMTDKHLGPTPMRVSADRAAQIIRRGLNRRQPYITFPLLLIVLIRIWNLLPTALADQVSQFLRARIVDPELIADQDGIADINAANASSSCDSE